ncbi:MAG: response regulator [Deltaproteobacteria bacterium]|nr:response regulator [Deltaproteobacteria bacterium]
MGKRSVALDETRRELLDRVKELTAINTLSQAVASSLSLDEILLAVYKYALSLIKADLAVVYLLDNDRLILPKMRPPQPRFLANAPEVKRVGECLCGLAVLNRQAIYVEDMRQDHRCTHEECKMHGVRSLAALPLLAGGDVLGVLGVGSLTERDFSRQGIFLGALAGHVAMALQNALLHERLERRAAELEHNLSEKQKVLQESQATLLGVFRAAPIGIGVVKDRILGWTNEQIWKMTGYSEGDLRGRSARILYETQEEFERVGRVKHPQVLEKGVGTIETRWKHKDGSLLDILLSSASIVPGDLSHGLVFTAMDMTERKRLVIQLQQAQKMEAIGTLAGGIAHDFNNILTPIIVRSELALLDLPGGSPARSHVEGVLKAGGRARDLVSQILTFSRMGERQKKPLRMSLIVKEALKFLRSSLPTTIEMRQQVTTESTVLADPTEVHQVIMNLCTNAAQAMRQKGGILEVGLHEILVDSELANRIPDLQPGPYVQLSVRDTGCGMEPWTVEKIFDPYFTTKERGEGTGLGLSVVHGIVKGLEGAITVESQPGKGSSFTIFIPRIAIRAKPEAEDAEPSLAGGSERVLLVDDERIMLDTVADMLRRLGYEVDASTDPREALRTFRSGAERYDLVITDQTMPGMTGAELAREILLTRPDTPTILCTGYSELITEEIAADMGIREFLMKPISIREMAESIRRVLRKET